MSQKHLRKLYQYSKSVEKIGFAAILLGGGLIALTLQFFAGTSLHYPIMIFAVTVTVFGVLTRFLWLLARFRFRRMYKCPLCGNSLEKKWCPIHRTYEMGDINRCISCQADLAEWHAQND